MSDLGPPDKHIKLSGGRKITVVQYGRLPTHIDIPASAHPDLIEAIHYRLGAMVPDAGHPNLLTSSKPEREVIDTVQGIVNEWTALQLKPNSEILALRSEFIRGGKAVAMNGSSVLTQLGYQGALLNVIGELEDPNGGRITGENRKVGVGLYTLMQSYKTKQRLGLS